MVVHICEANRPFSLGRFVLPLQTTLSSLENFSFIHTKFIHIHPTIENLKARILKSIITWSVMGQQNAQAKKGLLTTQTC